MSNLEELRRLRMAQNADVLRSLGIKDPVSPRAAMASEISSSTVAPKAHVPKNSSDDSPPRRSSRLRLLQANSKQASLAKRRRLAHDNSNEDSKDIRSSGLLHRLEVHHLPPLKEADTCVRGMDGSSMRLPCNVQRVTNALLGQHLKIEGKQFAMQQMAMGTTSPRFSKYSGVVEWQNAVVLWVNLDKTLVQDSGDNMSRTTISPSKQKFCNVFSRGGRRMAWFGGSRHHLGSRVIQRMVCEEDPILLFVRHLRIDYKGYSPYVPLGRVSIARVDAGDLRCMPQRKTEHDNGMIEREGENERGEKEMRHNADSMRLSGGVLSSIHTMECRKDSMWFEKSSKESQTPQLIFASSPSSPVSVELMLEQYDELMEKSPIFRAIIGSDG